MIGSIGIMMIALTAQAPAPDAAEKASAELRRERQAIVDRETEELSALADRLKRQGQAEAARSVLAQIEPPPPADGSTRFVPRPEIVSGKPQGLANVPAAAPRDDARAIRDTAARALFDLAGRAVEKPPKHFALADACLRAVLDRQPDHPEARRLLGYVPHAGGWATPFAVEQLRQGNVAHPTYGWVPASWVEHLDRGELPAPLERGQKMPRWLAAEAADNLHGDWNAAWKIPTEHFLIRTNVPMSEAIAFSRRLEAFHDLFFSILADVFGESDRSPLAQRFKNKKLVGEPPAKPHIVDYFATKQEFVDELTPTQGPDVANSLGLYVPPEGPKDSPRKPAYFFRDKGGQLPVTATLYHEVSHQLLFESGLGSKDPTAYRNNDGNYWVFEGLGTYFETLEVAPDGSLLIGGPIGPRMVEAARRLPFDREYVPLAEFVRLDQQGLHRKSDVHRNYQEAIALTVFFMQARGGVYREGFLDYVKDAYKGRVRRASGRSLEDRLDKRSQALDAEFLDFLKTVPIPEPAA